MSNSGTSTIPPYSNSGTSSVPPQPASYIPVASPTLQNSNESGFTTKEVLMYGGGLILTAVVTYFSTLISVNSDISNNRENISVMKSDITHIQENATKSENDIADIEKDALKIGVIEAKVTSLEKQLDMHINNKNK